MNKNFGQEVMTKTIPLSLLGLLLISAESASANVTIDNDLNIDKSNDLRQKVLTENQNESESRPKLISNQVFQKALLNTVAHQNGDTPNKVYFANLLEKDIKNTEFTISDNTKLNKDVIESKNSVVALESFEDNNTSIAIPVIQPSNNEQEIKKVIENPPASLDTDYDSSDGTNESSLINNTQQKSNQTKSEAIPIPITSYPVNNKLGNNTSIQKVNNYVGSQTYKVKKGDTLNSIAANHGVSKQELIRVNKLNNSNKININQTLKIPVASVTSASVPNKPTLINIEPPAQNFNNNNYQNNQNVTTIPLDVSKPSNNFNRKQPEMVSSVPIQIEYYNPANKPSPGEMVSPDLPNLYPSDQYLPNNNNNRSFNGYIWPAKGVLTSGYGWRWGRMHKGIDIAAPIGTPVVASSDGEVLTAGWNSGGYGNLIKLRHFDGSVTFYAHNSKIFVRRGERVAQGQQIAAMGSTGRSTGPHLHFEIRPQGKAVNPIAFLPRK